MNNKIEIEKLLKPADEALKTAGIVVQPKGESTYEDVLDEYDGYIAGFGAMVIHMGIKATLAFYMKDAGEERMDSKAYRSNVVTALALLVLPEHPHSDANVELKNVKKNVELKNKVLKISDRQYKELFEQTGQLLNASIALKLMLRTYKFRKDKKV